MTWPGRHGQYLLYGDGLKRRLRLKCSPGRRKVRRNASFLPFHFIPILCSPAGVRTRGCRETSYKLSVLEAQREKSTNSRNCATRSGNSSTGDGLSPFRDDFRHLSRERQTDVGRGAHAYLNRVMAGPSIESARHQTTCLLRSLLRGTATSASCGHWNSDSLVYSGRLLSTPRTHIGSRAILATLFRDRLHATA